MRRPAQVARKSLVDAAREVLLEGDGNLEVAAVAQRVGVSESLAYYHFGNKAGLLDAVIQDFYERLDESITAVPFEGATWRERERSRVSAIVDYMYRDPAGPLVANVVSSDPKLLRQQRERQRRLDELGARNIAQAQRDGEIDPDLDPHLLVSMILGGVLAGITHALSSTPPKPREDVEREIWSFVARAAGVDEG
jgi:AcrR family transcriptional regulator